MCLSGFCCCWFVSFTTTLFHKLINQRCQSPPYLQVFHQVHNTQGLEALCVELLCAPEHHQGIATNKSTLSYLQVFSRSTRSRVWKHCVWSSCMPQNTTDKSPPPYLQVFHQVHNTQGREALCVDLLHALDHHQGIATNPSPSFFNFVFIQFMATTTLPAGLSPGPQCPGSGSTVCRAPGPWRGRQARCWRSRAVCSSCRGSSCSQSCPPAAPGRAGCVTLLCWPSAAPPPPGKMRARVQQRSPLFTLDAPLMLCAKYRYIYIYIYLCNWCFRLHRNHFQICKRFKHNVIIILCINV